MQFTKKLTQRLGEKKKLQVQTPHRTLADIGFSAGYLKKKETYRAECPTSLRCRLVHGHPLAETLDPDRHALLVVEDLFEVLPEGVLHDAVGVLLFARGLCPCVHTALVAVRVVQVRELCDVVFKWSGVL